MCMPVTIAAAVVLTKYKRKKTDVSSESQTVLKHTMPHVYFLKVGGQPKQAFRYTLDCPNNSCIRRQFIN